MVRLTTLAAAAHSDAPRASGSLGIGAEPVAPATGDRIPVWGVPFAPLTRAGAVAAVAALIEAGRPSFFITANTHYLMLSNQHPELHTVNERAAFIVADGAPVVWASRRIGTPLPERVAGSDLIYDLCEQAVRFGHRVFLLGGAEGIASAAADRLADLYPGLQVVGTGSPPYRDLTDEENLALIARVREARPDLLFVATGQPKGELWINQNLERLEVPVCVQVGASFDFVAGRIRRAPRLLQRINMEWAYRLWQEPRRLGPRYARNAWFLLRVVTRGPRSFL